MTIEFFGSKKIEHGATEYQMAIDGYKLVAYCFNGSVGFKIYEGYSEDFINRIRNSLEGYIKLYSCYARSAAKKNPEHDRENYYVKFNNCGYNNLRSTINKMEAAENANSKKTSKKKKGKKK